MSNKKDEINKALETIYGMNLPEEIIDTAHQQLLKTIKDVLPPPVYYGLLPDTPIGDIWIASGEKGLIAIDFDLTEEEFCFHTQEKAKVRLVRGDEKMNKEINMINDYIDGDIESLDMDFDLRGLTTFQETVLIATKQIPRGQVATYSEIAQSIGNPKAYRAVGQALRYNPIPIVLPCHRVVNSNGTLGGYGGKMGSQRKIKLLQIEGVILT